MLITLKRDEGMYFLDANAWYWYFGRNELKMLSSAKVDEKKLITELDRIEKKSIPTSVYIEVVTHFRDNPELLQKLLKHRFVNSMKIYNNIPDYVIIPEEIEFTAYVGWDELKSYAYRMLDKKIDIEARFIYIFIEIMSLLFFAYKLDMTPDLSEEEKQSTENWIRKMYRQNSHEEKMIEIKDALRNGYMVKDEARIIKNKYIEILNRECIFFELILSGCVAVKEQKKDILSVLQSTYKKVVQDGLDGKNNTMKYIDDVLSTDSNFLDYAKKRFSNTFQKHGYTKMQCLYLKEVMFDAWMDRKQKLRKNDIFDMFCVGTLDFNNLGHDSNVLVDNNSYLISFDTVMEAFIKRNDDLSHNIICRYKTSDK